jgi:hypothetical protein
MAQRKVKVVRREPPVAKVTLLGPDKPPKHGLESWGFRLQPLVKNPGIWAEVRVFDTPQQAQDAQSNLTKRDKVGISIPMSEGDWEFASRGCALFAVYRGAKKRVTRQRRVR